MKKSILALITVFVALFAVLSVFTACNGGSGGNYNYNNGNYNNGYNNGGYNNDYNSGGYNSQNSGSYNSRW